MDEGKGKDKDNASKIRNVRDLKVYRKAFDLAMEIYEITKKFPKEETYSLTDQIWKRRPIRSVIRRPSAAVVHHPSEAGVHR